MALVRGGLSGLVDLRQGEGPLALFAFVTLFGLIAGHTILETARDALFLAKLDASQLALGYAALAVLSLVALGWAVRLASRFGRRNTLILTLMAASLGTIAFYFYPASGPVVFAFYLWSAFLGTVLTAQYWLLAGQVFTLAQGKRLFGPIAAGGVLGAVAGAGLAIVVLTFAPVRFLLLAAVAIFQATALFLTAMLAREARGRSPRAAQPQPLRQAGVTEALRESPYVRRLAALVALSTATMLVIDYLFKSTAQAALAPEELGPFFARYYAALNAAALVVQLALAGPLIRRLGVVAAAAVLPLLFLGGACAAIVAGGSLAIASLTRGADGAMRHSLHRVANELLFMPVPGELRERSKSALDSFVPRTAQALTGGLILAMTGAEIATPRTLSLVIAVLAAAWLVVVLDLRGHYIDLFRQALSKASLEPSGGLRALDLNSVEAVLEALSSREPARVIAAIDLLVDTRRSRLVPALILYHEYPEVLVHALRVFSASDRSDWVPLAERLLDHPSDVVRVEAVAALARRGLESAIRRAVADPSPVVRGHGAYYVARADLRTPPAEHPAVRAVVDAEGESAPAGRVALLAAICDGRDPRWVDVVLELATRGEPEIAEEVARAMKSIPSPRFVPLLIERLSSRNGRAAIRDALVAHGPAAQAALEAALLSPNTDPHVRLHVPRTIARFANQRAADFLTAQLGREPHGDVRYKVLRGLGRLAASSPVRIDRGAIEAELRKNLVEHLRVLALRAPIEAARGPETAHAEASESLLLGLLEDKANQALDRAFRLMQILFRGENIRGAYLALVSGDKRARATAVEFLDALTLSFGPEGATSSLRELLRIAVDELPDEERVRRAAAEGVLEPPPATVAEALGRLVGGHDAPLAAIAAYHALELGISGLRDAATRALRDRPSLGVPSEGAPLSAAVATGGVRV